MAAWIWGIAIRRLISRLRNRRDPKWPRSPDTNGWAPGTEEQVLLAVEYSDIGQAIGRLSPQIRAVIQAVVLDGLHHTRDRPTPADPRGHREDPAVTRAKVQLLARHSRKGSG